MAPASPVQSPARDRTGLGCCHVVNICIRGNRVCKIFVIFPFGTDVYVNFPNHMCLNPKVNRAEAETSL